MGVAWQRWPNGKCCPLKIRHELFNWVQSSLLHFPIPSGFFICSIYLWASNAFKLESVDATPQELINMSRNLPELADLRVLANLHIPQAQCPGRLAPTPFPVASLT